MDGSKPNKREKNRSWFEFKACNLEFSFSYLKYQGCFHPLFDMLPSEWEISSQSDWEDVLPSFPGLWWWLLLFAIVLEDSTIQEKSQSKVIGGILFGFIFQKHIVQNYPWKCAIDIRDSFQFVVSILCSSILTRSFQQSCAQFWLQILKYCKFHAFCVYKKTNGQLSRTALTYASILYVGNINYKWTVVL